MFMQVDTSLERSTSGLGLDLTLVRNLAILHGGTVEAQSAGIGQGSEFTVRLPILAKAPEPSKPDADMPKPIATRRILVVDDNRNSATSLTMLMRLSGHETRTACDGLEALNTAKVFLPDVILLDIDCQD